MRGIIRHGSRRRDFGVSVGVRLLEVQFRVRFLIVLSLRRGRRAKGRHFDDFLAEMHMREAEAAADEAAVAEQAAHFLGQRVGGHIEVFGGDPQQ